MINAIKRQGAMGFIQRVIAAAGTAAVAWAGSAAVPFAWMDGSKVENEKPVHGTINVPAESNTPGARAGAATWLDSNGDLWLFGGNSPWYVLGEFSVQGLYRMGDLWFYDVETGVWTFKHGLATGDAGNHPPPTNYGTQGVEDPANYPAARVDAASWTAGSFWMFGGQAKTIGNENYLADLWRYNSATNAWTWMGGSTELNDSGSLDEGQVKNFPAARNGSMTWTDSAGDLWLYGGYVKQVRECPQCPPFGGYFADNIYLNDLWRFDVDASQWIEVKEADIPVVSGTLQSDRLMGQSGIFGEKGVSDPANWPGGREEAYVWTDADNNFWMYGGYGVAGSEAGALNDLWLYKPATGQWTWMSGSQVIDQPPVFDTDENSTASLPGGRYAGAAWTDHSGRLSIFGGYGTTVNDLWQYDPSANTWSWHQYPTLSGNYSPKGFASKAYYPGLRSDAMAWNTAQGDLWLFGGLGYAESGTGYLSDVWKTEQPPAAASAWELYE